MEASMAEDHTCLSILFNRQYNMALQQHCRFGSGQVTKFADYTNSVPADKSILYFKDLEQPTGRTVWGFYHSDAIAEPASLEQIEKLERIAIYLIVNDVAFQFGIDNNRFYIALDSKDHAMMLKLSY